jgi:hypothetical protein
MTRLENTPTLKSCTIGQSKMLIAATLKRSGGLVLDVAELQAHEKCTTCGCGCLENKVHGVAVQNVKDQSEWRGNIPESLRLAIDWVIGSATRRQTPVPTQAYHPAGANEAVRDFECMCHWPICRMPLHAGVTKSSSVSRVFPMRRPQAL